MAFWVEGQPRSDTRARRKVGHCRRCSRNVRLNSVDKELEKRGYSFVRYADDCNVYMRSKRAGERVIGPLRRLYTRLKLRISESKSAVDTPRVFVDLDKWIRHRLRAVHLEHWERGTTILREL